MDKNLLSVVICILSLLIAGCSTPLERGNAYYQQGLYDQAAFQWNSLANAGDPYAQHNLGLLWEQGLGMTPKNLNEAAAWYLKSAQQGFPPAMVRLASIQISLGMETPALTWLNHAARWGDQDAVSILRSKSLAVPSPDLLQQSIATSERQNQENMDALMGLILIGAMAESASNGSVVNPGYLPSTNSSSTSGTLNCGIKPIPRVGYEIGRCINGQWEQVSRSTSSTLNCGIKPIPNIGYEIGRCINGQWEQVSNPTSSTLNCGIKPIPNIGYEIGRCINGQWEQVSK